MDREHGPLPGHLHHAPNAGQKTGADPQEGVHGEDSSPYIPSVRNERGEEEEDEDEDGNHSDDNLDGPVPHIRGVEWKATLILRKEGEPPAFRAGFAR